jgi:hypothetical protein
MKYLVNMLLWVTLGILLTISDVNCYTWRYWAIFACVFAMNINTTLW